MADLNEILKAPSWNMEDAYGDIRSERYEHSVSEIEKLITTLNNEVCVDQDNVLCQLQTYSDAMTLISSLQCFVKCTGAKDSDDDRTSDENARLAALSSRLTSASGRLFQFIAEIPSDDVLWQKAPLSDWKFEISQRRAHWVEKLSEQDKQWYGRFEQNCFLPLGDIFKTLQKRVDIKAVDSRGNDVRVKAAKMVAVIKGDPDKALRSSVFEGYNKYYAQNGELYCALLNELHGFRLASYERAGVTPLEVSLHQNRMSEKALKAMSEVILKHIDLIREAVSLRAPYFGESTLSVYNLMCPAPKQEGKVPELIPYVEALDTVKQALGRVSPDMSNFIQMMLDKRWVEATVSDKKIGGAFYSRFNEFKMPRVFSSYMGTITALLQQGHELGHAFHYWQMRDLPMIQTEFPMTLTEMASTFNEAVIRQYLLSYATDSTSRFDMLWQELRSAANFLMNTMVRMDFELEFLKEREKGFVSQKRCVELMQQSWKRWYGDSTDGADDYLWAYKLHYYKVDQLIYNYPYTVGYLLSQGLMYEWQVRGDQFIDFYRNMLRDTGRMTLDELVEKHFGVPATSHEFWERCIAAPLESINQFKKDFQITI